MATEQSVRCEVPYFPAVVVSFGLMWLVGLGVAGFRWLRHGPTHPGEFLILGGLLALTVCIGLLRSGTSCARSSSARRRSGWRAARACGR